MAELYGLFLDDFGSDALPTSQKPWSRRSRERIPTELPSFSRFLIELSIPVVIGLNGNSALAQRPVDETIWSVADTINVGQLNTANFFPFRPAEVSAAKICSAEIRFAQISFGQIGSAEIGVLQVC